MTLTIQPNPLVGGDPATVTISGSSKTNQRVTVTITDESTGMGSTVEILLDDTGNGSSGWDVPSSWHEATFEYGTCLPVQLAVT